MTESRQVSDAELAAAGTECEFVRICRKGQVPEGYVRRFYAETTHGQVELAVADPSNPAQVRYVTPDAAMARDGTVLAVRLWLRVRSDVTEGGFDDARSLAYADVSFTPTAGEAKMRRLLIERTVALRNVAPGGAR